MNTVNKAAMSKGMSHFILVLYSNMLGVLLLLSSSFMFYRQVTFEELPVLLHFFDSLLTCSFHSAERESLHRLHGP